MQSHKIPHRKAKDLHQPKKSYTAIYLILLKILTAGKKKSDVIKNHFIYYAVIFCSLFMPEAHFVDYGVHCFPWPDKNTVMAWYTTCWGHESLLPQICTCHTDLQSLFLHCSPSLPHLQARQWGQDKSTLVKPVSSSTAQKQVHFLNLLVFIPLWEMNCFPNHNNHF